MREITVESLGDLIDVTTPRVPDPASRRLRDHAVFRGVADEQWELTTSLDRLGGPELTGTKHSLEYDIFRNFVRYAHSYFPQNIASRWEMLALAQHHGLPTRLLDWSYSPLVAAHFATVAANRQRRAVYRLNWMKLHQAFDIKPRALTVEELEEELQQRGCHSLKQLLQGDGLGEKGFVALVDPPSVDPRIVAQSGTFMFCTEKGKTIADFIEARGLSDALTRYVIPSHRVAQVRDQLDMCSVDERRLFPGLDGVAAEMRRYYS